MQAMFGLTGVAANPALPLASKAWVQACHRVAPGRASKKAKASSEGPSQAAVDGPDIVRGIAQAYAKVQKPAKHNVTYSRAMEVRALHTPLLLRGAQPTLRDSFCQAMALPHASKQLPGQHGNL